MQGFSDFRISIKNSLVFGAPFVLFLFPLRWILAAVLAACVHEIYHMAAIRFLGGRVYRLQIGLTGAQMETNALTTKEELLAALAGPIGSLSLLFLYRWLPYTAFCGFVHAVYNLLPIYPLDGGRIVHCAMSFIMPERTERCVCRWIAWIAAVGWGAALTLVGLRWIWSILIVFLLILRTSEKFLANIPKSEYNSVTNCKEVTK